jgi:hypothetical protein
VLYGKKRQSRSEELAFQRKFIPVDSSMVTALRIPACFGPGARGGVPDGVPIIPGGFFNTRRINRGRLLSGNIGTADVISRQ